MWLVRGWRMLIVIWGPESEYSLCSPAETLEENQTVTALMKRLSLSAEDKERSAAVSEIVALVKKGGVGALKVTLCFYSPPGTIGTDGRK